MFMPQSFDSCRNTISIVIYTLSYGSYDLMIVKTNSLALLRILNQFFAVNIFTAVVSDPVCV